MPKALSAQRDRPPLIHALTSLRFAAALYVVFFHEFPQSRDVAPFVLKFINLGFVSVSFFFLLSGYILAIVYLPRTGELDKTRFFIARFSRIYPLFFLTLVADTPFLLRRRIILYGLGSATVKTMATFIGHMFLLQAWITKLQFSINEPSWSLSVEAALYLSFPILGRALWRLQGRSIWLTAAAIYVGGQFTVWLFTPFLDVNQVKFNPLFHVSTFCIGVLLARWQRIGNPLNSSGMPRSIYLYSALASSAILFLLVVKFSALLPFTNIHDGLLAPMFAAVIWALSYPQFRVSRWLSQRWLVVLGESSFGLYLLHIVILHWYRGNDARLSPHDFAVYLTLCIGLSVLLFYAFEAPARRWLIATFKSSTPETLEAASDA